MPSLKGYEKAELVGIADPKPDKLKQAADYYDIDGRYEDYHDILAVPGLDGVVIAIPHAYHYQVARDALDAGVHVLVEKPMVLKATEAWDLVRRAEEKGLHLSVGYTFQHTRHARRAKRDRPVGSHRGYPLHIGAFRLHSRVVFPRQERRLSGGHVRLPGNPTRG